MKGKVYYVVNNGNIVYSSADRDNADGVADYLTEEALRSTVEESGRSIDDLTDDELGEFAVMSGAEGGSYQVKSVEVPEEYNENDEFTTDEDDTYTYKDLLNTYEQMPKELSDTYDFEFDDLDDILDQCENIEDVDRYAEGYDEGNHDENEEDIDFEFDDLDDMF